MTNLKLTAPAVTRALDRITADNEALDRRLAMEEDAKRMRERNEELVTAYIRNFWLKEQK